MITVKKWIFPTIFKESNEDDDTIEFDYVDLSDLKIKLPPSVSDVELAFSKEYYTYRLNYTLNGETIVKYIAKDNRDLKHAQYLASVDAEIPDDDDIFKHVSVLCSNLITSGFNSRPIPMEFQKGLIETVKTMFPNGHCDKKSSHVSDTSNNKLGHGSLPDELFDEWSSRVINYMPSDVRYIMENVPDGKIFIPVCVAYKGKVKELTNVSRFVKEQVKKSYKMKNWDATPGITRVFDLVDRCIITEFFFWVSPGKEKTYNMINTQDSEIQPWSLDRFDRNVVKDMKDSLIATIKYYKDH